MAVRSCRSAALAYARRGWAVFPLQGKRPFPGTHGHRDATIDLRQIRRWWHQWPHANVGIACSSQQGPIVIDIDGTTGAQQLSQIQIPVTREASSGSAHKRHLYFDPLHDGTSISRLIRPLGKDVALDVLGDGGYVVAPPSRHPDTGRRYRWVRKFRVIAFPPEIWKLIQRTKQHGPAPPLPAILTEGSRDTLLTSLAGSMRLRGASEQAIFAALKTENILRVHPPLPEQQLRKIAKSIGAKQNGVIEHFTDLGNARRFITQHQRDVRSVIITRNPWLIWDGQRWANDTTGMIHRLAKTTIRRVAEEASAVSAKKRDTVLRHELRSESAPRIRAMLELAATEPELCTPLHLLDASPWLLNVENGTLNLRTGVVDAHRRKHLITKLAPITYDPTARAPRWKQFLYEIMDHDTELISFLQRAVGYSLTGDTREQCLFFCYGQGANGKTTFLETIRTMMGEYGKQADFNSFTTQSHADSPRSDLARMHGARLITASEADSEKGFDARTLKMLTGGDTIVARELYEKLFEFRPCHKLFLVANHKPLVKEQTEAFWRRMRLVPFTVMFTPRERDKQLGEKLRQELPGILNWALAGCQQWRTNGLQEPSAVRKATRSYQSENDILGEYLQQRCKKDTTAWISMTALYQSFSDWWVETRGSRTKPISIVWLGRLLSERPEFHMGVQRNQRGWYGIALRNIQS